MVVLTLGDLWQGQDLLSFGTRHPRSPTNRTEQILYIPYLALRSHVPCIEPPINTVNERFHKSRSPAFPCRMFTRHDTYLSKICIGTLSVPTPQSMILFLVQTLTRSVEKKTKPATKKNALVVVVFSQTTADHGLQA